MSLAYFSILCIMCRSLASESSGIRGFQDIKMRPPNLNNADFAVKDIAVKIARFLLINSFDMKNPCCSITFTSLGLRQEYIVQSIDTH